MTDKLRDLLREVKEKGLIYWEPNTTRGHERKAEMISRIDLALAAAPQPAPVMQYYYKDNACPAEHSRAETCICWHDEGKGPFPELKNGDAVPVAYGSAVGLTWRARPADALLARGLRLQGGEETMEPDHDPMPVGDIGNYYGGLFLKRENGVDYWSIENYDGFHWEACDPAVARAIRVVEGGDDAA